MDSDTYARAKEIFQKAILLNKAERQILIERECKGQAEIRAEVESLLRFHEDDPKVGVPPDYTPMKIAFESTQVNCLQRRFRRLIQHRLARFALLIGIVLIIAMAAGLGRDKLKDALVHETAGHLESVLNSNFQAIELWSSYRFGEAEKWGALLQNDPALKQLLEIGRSLDNPGNALMQAQAQDDLNRLIEPSLKAGPFQHFFIFNHRYLNIATNIRPWVGKKLTADSDLIAVFDRILSGEKFFTPRRLLGSAFNTAGATVKPQYFSWFSVPIRDREGRVIAGLAFGLDAAKYFDQIIEVGRWGSSGETYAFNTKGVLLSESRFTNELVEIGLLEKDKRSGLNISLKDPGGNLSQGFRPENRIEDWPYTKIVSKALDRLRLYTDAMQGQLLEPYRDYRGVDVIGAWRWHPNLYFGIITEIDADEALLTLRVIDFLYITLVVLMAVATLLAAVSYLAFIRIRPAARMGARMGQYSLLRKIAEGGIGEIYLAKHAFLKRPTAIKILKADNNDPESLTRFEAEVRATSQLSHPNTVAIYDFGRTADRNFYYAMEFLPGISLARLIEMEKHLPYHRAVHLLLQVCGSLKEAHALGMIHRDIKPLNIMICRIGGDYDVVKVIDFGLVKRIKDLVPLESIGPLSSDLRGTPAYIAPELLSQPSAASPQTDIYSLGVVAYKMLSGHNLFDATHEAGLLYDIVHTKPKNLSELRPELPPALVKIVMQCIEKNPLMRPPSMVALCAELTATLNLPSWSQDDAKEWWGLRDDLLLLAE
ncbi:MAG TPA: protein kinase [Oligoflexus sp.]|uniref:protein kinase domain-containing protein n=1 Tax=Oligoflexus sp. TaxID=1971216 RepID=UPI002D6B1A1B|nr:protein kinase [Oligoflexus sp.]HYX31520.1 protein kinase [Oligoflexus sp.]